MEWIEVDPLPAVCLRCKEQECYNCDYAGARWVLSHKDELRVRRNAIQKKIERLQKELSVVELEIENLSAQETAR